MASTRVIWSNIVAPPTADITTSISCSLSSFSISALSEISPWKYSKLQTHVTKSTRKIRPQKAKTEKNRDSYIYSQTYMYDYSASVFEAFDDVSLRWVKRAWPDQNIGGLASIKASFSHKPPDETSSTNNEDSAILGCRNTSWHGHDWRLAAPIALDPFVICFQILSLFPK